MCSLTLRAGLAFMAHNMLAPLNMAARITGPERNRAALSNCVSAYPALLEDFVCALLLRVDMSLFQN
jgi:hypothetical protein